MSEPKCITCFGEGVVWDRHHGRDCSPCPACTKPPPRSTAEPVMCSAHGSLGCHTCRAFEPPPRPTAAELAPGPTRIPEFVGGLDLVDAFDELLRRYRALEAKEQTACRTLEVSMGWQKSELASIEHYATLIGQELSILREDLRALEAAARPVLELASVSVPKMRICDTPDNAFESMCALRALLPKEEP